MSLNAASVYKILRPLIDELRTLVSGVASSTGSGGPAPGTPAYNPAWYAQQAIYVDPANASGHASDKNNGTSPTTPLLTMAEVVRRYGSPEPKLVNGQNLTLTFLSSQAINTDNFYFDPVPSGGGIYAMLGTPKLVATFNLGVVTAKDRATAQNLQSTGFTAAGLAQGQLVVNNVTGSRALIEGLAAGTATLSQPLAPLNYPADVSIAPMPAEDNTWAGGQSVSVYSLCAINLIGFDAKGGQTVTSAGDSVCWGQYVVVWDTESTAGTSTFQMSTQGVSTIFVDSVFQPYTVTGYGPEGATSYYLIGCGGEGGYALEFAAQLGGYSHTYGTGLVNRSAIDLDAICRPSVGAFGGDGSILGNLYVDTGGLFITSANAWLDGDVFGLASQTIWGPCEVSVSRGGNLLLIGAGGGITWTASLLNTGGFGIDGSTTATSYTPGAPGVFTDGVAITPGTLDANGGLQNPRTGSKFSSFA